MLIVASASKMRRKYLLGASIIATLLFFSIDSSLAAANGISQALVIDGRARSHITEPNTIFKFFAENICNEDIGKNGLCLNIWGKGSASANTVSAYGGYETYRGKQVDLNRVERLSRGTWSPIDTLTITDQHISFKARTSSGIVFVELTEGKLENSGQVCIYGPLIAIQNADDAVCVDNALVVIEKMNK